MVSLFGFKYRLILLVVLLVTLVLPSLLSAHYLSEASIPAARIVQKRRHVRASKDGAKFLKYFELGKIGGWMDASSLMLIVQLSQYQHTLGLEGAVGEIGVHHGLSFLALALSSYNTEPLWVCDVFSHQHLNVDGSGNGNYKIFLENVNMFGIVESNLNIYGGSSTNITSFYFRNLSLPRFRFFSIDGGHTDDITYSDLVLASEYLVDGGIIALDDIKNNAWIGVRKGLLRFLKNFEHKFTPFVANYKIFIAAVPYYSTYFAFVQTLLLQFSSVVELNFDYKLPYLIASFPWNEPLDLFLDLISVPWNVTYTKHDKVG